MNTFKCLVDGSTHSTLPDLHLHLRKLKVKQSDYYETYLPRYDLLTGEKIPFKDYESYKKVDFLNKNNLNKWAKLNPEKAVAWVEKYLSERKLEKNLTRAPSHFELRTLFCPSVKFIQQHTDYNELCKRIGLAPQFDYSAAELAFEKLPENYSVFIDSREQNPIKFVRGKVKKLEYGDYTLDESINSNIFIERKSLADLVGTVSRGYERFYREIERAKKDDAYLIVAVEVDYNTFQSFNKDYRMRHTKVSPEHVFKNMRDLLLEFDNLQFVFFDGRTEFAEKMIKIYQLGETAKKLDLQYYYEKGLI